ncbi:hypothetical protein ILYODFUR_027190, partial [Ilyodon furcidens]
MLLEMDPIKSEMDRHPGLMADWENPESCAEKKQRKIPSCTVMDDQSTSGNWSQTSISQSLQRAEILFKNTFNPSLKWLFHIPSQDEKEENLVVVDNLVSQSSARLQRVQQHLLTVVLQWQLVGGGFIGPLPGQYKALWRLFEQRSLLLFIHEYTRRVHLTAAFITRVNYLLQHQLNKLHLMHTQ